LDPFLKNSESTQRANITSLAFSQDSTLVASVPMDNSTEVFMFRVCAIVLSIDCNLLLVVIIIQKNKEHGSGHNCGYVEIQSLIVKEPLSAF
jgi:hypothetical protein